MITILPGAAGVYPRNCPGSIPAASGARWASGMSPVSPGDCGRYPPPGVYDFCACPWLAFFVLPRPAVAPDGPFPQPQSARRRYGRLRLFRFLPGGAARSPPRFPALRVGGGSPLAGPAPAPAFLPGSRLGGSAFRLGLTAPSGWSRVGRWMPGIARPPGFRGVWLSGSGFLAGWFCLSPRFRCAVRVVKGGALGARRCSSSRLPGRLAFRFRIPGGCWRPGSAPGMAGTKKRATGPFLAPGPFSPGAGK